MDARTLVYDRGKLAGMMALGLFGALVSGLVARWLWPALQAGLVTASIVAIAAILGVMGSLLLVGLCLRRFIRPVTAATFDDDGVTITTLFRTHRLEWDEIERIGFMDAAPNHIVKLARVGRRMDSYPLIAVRGDGQSVPQWFAAMLAHWPPNRFRRKYGRPYP